MFLYFNFIINFCLISRPPGRFLFSGVSSLFGAFALMSRQGMQVDKEKNCTFAPVKIVRTSILPFRGFSAINLLGVLFVHHGVYLSNELINHERIHTAQQREMLFVFFYLAYVVEWLMRLPMRGNAYRNISFEREGYAHQRDLHYLESRRHYAWRRYMKKPLSRTKKK